VKRIHLILWAVFLIAPWSTLHADAWGRLFTTQIQRAQLDSGQTAPKVSGNSSSESSQAAAIKPIQLTGTLTSSHGKRTVWLNGKPVTQGVRILGAGRVQLRITSADDSRLMKSGQLIYPQSGEIVEGYSISNPSPTDTTMQTEMESADVPM